MCGDSGPDDEHLTPHVNPKDVSKSEGNNLTDAITPSDGQESLKPGNQTPFLEAFESRTFVDVFDALDGIPDDLVPSAADTAWENFGNQLHTSARAFERTITRLKEGGGWEGKTIDAAFTNAINSTSQPFYTGTAALRAAQLTGKFREVMNWVRSKMVDDPNGQFPTLKVRYTVDLNYDYYEMGSGGTYTTSGSTTAEEKEYVRQDYNNYMRTVMNDSYKPGITAIYDGYPQFVENNAPATPIEVPGLPQQPTQPTHNPGGNPGTGPGSGGPSMGGPGGFSPGGPGTPSSLSSSLPGSPQLQTGELCPEGLVGQNGLQVGDPQNPGLNTPGQNMPGQNGPPLPSQTGMPAGALGNAANQALGSAMGAAKPPATTAASLGSKPKLPEGALDLGKKGPGTGGPKGAGAGGGAAGGGTAGGSSLAGAARDLTRGLAGLATAGIQAGEAATRAALGAAGAAAGQAGAPGSPGAAGHGAGSGANGKEHKAAKALRSAQNGFDIVDQGEAVVAVIGEDQQDAPQDPGQGAKRPAKR